MRALDAFMQLYGLHDPTSYARMLRPGARHKYHKVHRAPTRDDLDAHLAGDETIAVPLIGAAGLSYHVALDIDHGGVDALHRALNVSQALGWIAYAITSTNNEHSGGHLWIHLDQPTAPARARLLAEQIAVAAGISTTGHDPDAETYPTMHALRLPFGVHRWTKRRGQLLLQDGTSIDLDAGAAAIRAAIATVAHLPQNTTANLPDLPPPPVRNTARQTRQERPHAPTNPIQEYNHSTNLIDLLEQHGSHVADTYRDGSMLMHCPCGQHQHGDAQASLEVRPARNTSRYGQYVAVGHAPHCRFYAEHRQVMDAFTVYCRLEGLTIKEALQQIYGCRPSARRAGDPNTSGGNTPSGSEPPPLPPATTPSYDTRKAERIEDAAELHAELRTRAEQDATLGATAHRVLDALLLIADERDWCRPSKATIAYDILGDVSERTVQRALSRLEQRQYIATDEHTTATGTGYRGGASTPIRRFLRGTPISAALGDMSPVVNELSESLTSTQNTWEGGADTHAAGMETGGASYNPADDWTAKANPTVPHREWRSNTRPKDLAVWQWMREARAQTANVCAQTRAAAVQEQPTHPKAGGVNGNDVPTAYVFPRSRPVGSVQHAGPQVQLQPPSDPQRRKEYAKLLGKAKRVERSSPRQAAYLRARARQLEEAMISVPAPTSEEPVLGEIDCPAMWRTPSARGLVPVQLMLPDDDHGELARPPSHVPGLLQH